MLKHADIWRAIDRLAERNGLSPSGLARKAGLCATSFNPSKRIHGTRKRWPSTESIAAILQATNTNLDSFVTLANHEVPLPSSLPILSLAEAAQPDSFDEAGLLASDKWDRLAFPGSQDPRAFALELTGKSFAPLYREGDNIILSPAEHPRRGDRVAVRTRRGEIIIKLLGREGAQKIELSSFSADDPPLTLSRSEIDWIYRIIWASQ